MAPVGNILTLEHTGSGFNPMYRQILSRVFKIHIHIMGGHTKPHKNDKHSSAKTILQLLLLNLQHF